MTEPGVLDRQRPSTSSETVVDHAGLDPARLPRHVAIIMDGNGRWAQRQGRERAAGHQRGTETVRTIVQEASRLGIGQLTLYCLSSENWKRPPEELAFLLTLLESFLIAERPEIVRQNLQFSVIGRREGLGEAVLKQIDETYEAAATNTGMRLCLAINYGSRAEITDAIREIADRVAAGELTVEEITEEVVSQALYTGGTLDPDLVIRTAGEMRLSNFLLWQLSYAEIWVTDTLWPAFDIPTFHQALTDFARRDRRFGGLKG